jgi:glycerol uptake facilitator-like aquaporin
MSHLARRALAELVGTAGLVAAVVGSGIMATRLTQDAALQLLVNALAAVAALTVLIWTLGPVSGAHFNPLVSLVAAVRREMPIAVAGLYAWRRPPGDADR